MSEMTRDELRDALDAVADLRTELVVLRAKLAATEQKRDAERARADTLEAALAEVRERTLAAKDGDGGADDRLCMLAYALSALPADLARELRCVIRALRHEHGVLCDERDEARQLRDEAAREAAEARTRADTLAAALAEVREKARAYREVAETPPGNLDTVQDVARDDLDRALSALPADLARAAEKAPVRPRSEVGDDA